MKFQKENFQQRNSFPRTVGRFFIGLYQSFFSSFFGIGGACRFHPSCSVYADEAIHTHGLVRGSWLTIKRISKCHPFGRHGFDPVPEVQQ